MKIGSFYLLNDLQKEEAIWNDGIFLMRHGRDNIIADTYQLFDFYVELCYPLDKEDQFHITANVHLDLLPFFSKLY